MNNRELFRQNLQELSDDELLVKGKQIADDYEKVCLDGSCSGAAFLYFDLRQIEDEIERRHCQARIRNFTVGSVGEQHSPMVLTPDQPQSFQDLVALEKAQDSRDAGANR